MVTRGVDQKIVASSSVADLKRDVAECSCKSELLICHSK